MSKTSDEIRTIVRAIHSDFIDTINSKRPDETVDAIKYIEDKLNDCDFDEVTRETVDKQLHDEIFGFGPITDYVTADNITEIMVNGPEEIYIERNGKLILTDRQFDDEEHLKQIIRLRIVEPMNRRLDDLSPTVDARLEDGSRVNAVLFPVAVSGTTLNIRKFPRVSYTPLDLINFGTWSVDMCDFLRDCIKGRLNMIISGGTGSGKTTTLNVLSGFVPDDERIVTIEDAAELKLANRHVVRLETRPANLEGKGAITTQHLVRNTLRMRPDRIIVGECRGAEAFDMLTAMNTGHEGSLTTIHCNTPRDALTRVEDMNFMADSVSPPISVRRKIASAIHLIVHQERCSDGQRRVTHISEITGMEADKISMHDIFLLHSEKISETETRYSHMPTAIPPLRALEKLALRGIEIDRDIFVVKKGRR